MKPRVTVGTCVRDGAATLAEAVESVLAQDYPHELMEIIFVDDGSTDNSDGIMKRYVGKTDMRSRVFSQPWRGLGASRQLIVNAAEGEYIVWVDCDMVLPTDHVRKQIDFMDRNPKVGIAKARYELSKEDNAVAILENIPFVLHDSRNGSLDLKLPGTGGAVFRVEAIRKVGGFDSKLVGVGEDQDAAFRVKSGGWLIMRSPAIFYEKRVNTWKNLWRKWFWYGQGDHQLYQKNRNVFSLFRMNPLAGVVNGLLQVSDAYRLTGKIPVLILPFHSAFRMFAWCFGFSSNADWDLQKKWLKTWSSIPG